jgi:hypothetical protein
MEETMNDYDVNMTFKIAFNIISEKQYADHDEDSHDDAALIFADEMRLRYVAEDGDFETYMADRMACFETQWFEFEKAA